MLLFVLLFCLLFFRCHTLADTLRRQRLARFMGAVGRCEIPLTSITEKAGMGLMKTPSQRGKPFGKEKALHPQGLQGLSGNRWE